MVSRPPDVRIKWESTQVNLGDVTDLTVAEGQFTLINEGGRVPNEALITITTELPNLGLGFYFPPNRNFPIIITFGLVVAEFLRENVDVKAKFYTEGYDPGTGELVRQFNTPVFIRIADQTVTASLLFEVRIKRKPFISRNAVKLAALSIFIALLLFLMWRAFLGL